MKLNLLTHLFLPWLFEPLNNTVCFLSELPLEKTKVHKVRKRERAALHWCYCCHQTQQKTPAPHGQIFPRLQSLWSDHQPEKDKCVKPRCGHPPPIITINNYKLDANHPFTYLGSTLIDNLCLGAKINKCIGISTTIQGWLSTRVWLDSKLTIFTKIAFYVCTVLYGSETWMAYAK